MPFTDEQLAAHAQAICLELRGCPELAKLVRAALSESLCEHTPEAAKARKEAGNGGNRPFYGQFTLNEADRNALGHVESPLDARTRREASGDPHDEKALSDNREHAHFGGTRP